MIIKALETIIATTLTTTLTYKALTKTYKPEIPTMKKVLYVIIALMVVIPTFWIFIYIPKPDLSQRLFFIQLTITMLMATSPLVYKNFNKKITTDLFFFIIITIISIMILRTEQNSSANIMMMYVLYVITFRCLIFKKLFKRIKLIFTN
ncbi:MAG: hypothetical protein WC725_04700 [Patescibacteria group bacterium]|jgi:hypothetical protein